MNYKQQLKQIETDAILAMKKFMHTLARIDIVYPISNAELAKLTRAGGWYAGQTDDKVKNLLIIQHINYTITNRQREILKMHPRYERIKRWRCVILY